MYYVLLGGKKILYYLFDIIYSLFRQSYLNSQKSIGASAEAMSLFRKPKKIQRRVFCADDEEDGEPEPPPPPLITQRRERKENVSVKAPKLLSFVHEGN